MGNNIRIGKDFNVQWAINKVVDGERLPYDLVGKELQLYIVNDNGRKEVAGWKVQGNVIEWTFLGKDQKRIGAYQLVLVENAGKEGMVTVDTCKAFNLVEHSCEENVDGGNDIVIKTVTLESEVALAPVVKEGASYDDTEIKEDIAKLQQNKEDKINKVTSLSDESTDVQYPSAKTVYELIKRLEERIVEQDQFIEDLQNTKIEKENDDYYPKMAVGLADNLAGVDVVESEINFRRSGGGAITDGVARIEAIKGNSVVWNQVFNAANIPASQQKYAKPNEDGTIEVVSSPSSVWVTLASSNPRIIAGHNYLIAFNVVRGAYSSTDTYADILGVTIRPNTPTIVPYKGGSSTAALRAVECLGMVFRIDIHDLTQMFCRGNEPTTIEEFYARIPMGVDMNAYNEGEAIHMDVQSIESVGVNQWDEEWEKGSMASADGSLISGVSNRFRSKNLINVIPGASYYGLHNDSSTLYMFWYDEDMNYLGNKGMYAGYSIVAPTGAKYGRFYITEETYNHDICINLSDPSINGKYFPYIKRVEDLSIIRKYFPDGMKSAGSAHDEIRYNKATQKREYSKGRMKEVDLGTLNYTRSASSGVFFCEVNSSAIKGVEYGDNILCSRYATYTGEKTPTMLPDKSLMLYNGASYPLFGINDTAYTDVASFKAAMQGVILYYEAAEWEWVELDEADQFKDLDYKVWNAGTEKAIAEGKSAPLAADITYGFNAIGKIKELESLVAALRAKVGI